MTMQPLSPPRVLLFDVNETLLDLAPLRACLAQALEGREALLPLWFTTLLHQSLVLTVAGRYRGFGEIAVAALQAVARDHGIDLATAAAREAVAPMRQLPAHADAAPALLTNSSADLLAAQLDHAGLAGLFDRQLSVDAVQRFKPHPEVYRWAAQEVGADIGETLMTAAHGWDVAGAMWAGARAVMVCRGGRQPLALAEAPETCVADFTELADYLLGLRAEEA